MSYIGSDNLEQFFAKVVAFNRWQTQVTLEKWNSVTRSGKSQRIISTASKTGIGKRPGRGKREIDGVKKGTRRLQTPRGVTESGNIKIHQAMTRP